MLFNSFAFLAFFIAFFTLYWLVARSYKLQNLIVIVGGVIFYGWWDWRFLFLLLFSTVVGFAAAQLLDRNEGVTKRRVILWCTVAINIGLLLFFKYFNFFIQSWIDFLAIFDIRSDVRLLEIILPIGISFYTFQKLSYVIDVYNKKISASRDFIQFLAYVSFFPQLLAGPIERATTLLPQFKERRVFNSVQAMEGVQLIIYGLFKKVVVGDNCAMFVNTIWENYDTLGGITLVIGAVFFAFQIYGDFSGYTDIAKGTAKLLGFELMVNFRYPYFSRTVSEFWKRWHISLSSWFRDYVYIPLGGSRVNTLITARNVLIIFLLSGVWHGANWTFVIWGLVNALCILPAVLINTQKSQTAVIADQTVLPTLRECMQVIITFLVVCLGWIFFRSNSVGEAFSFISRIFLPDFTLSFFTKSNSYFIIFAISFAAIVQLLLIEFLCRKQDFVSFSRPLLWCTLLLIEITYLGSYKNHFEFIYFQF